MIPLNLDRNEIALERVQFAVSHSVYRAQLDDRDLEVTCRAVGDSLVFQLAAYLYGKRTEGQLVRYPATWWDAVKVRWFRGRLAWALRRWPVTWVEFRPEMLELYPGIAPALNGPKRIVFAEFERLDVYGK